MAPGVKNLIDFKYHIASLVAVFLALGIGILIGSTMLGNDTLIEYQKQVTDRLETQLENLRQKNESLQASANSLQMDLNLQKDFNKKILPYLLDDRLEGTKLAILETNGYRFSGDLINVLEMAGAEVTSVTSFMNFAGIKEDLARDLGWQEEQEEVEGERPQAFVASLVAQSLLSGDMNKINPLVQHDLVRITGSYGEPLDAVIIVGGSQDEKNAHMEELDLPIIKFLQKNGLPVYGVEESTALYSYMEFYQSQRLPATVDNIDTVPGQLALVLAIDGQPGNYGIKNNAKRLLPEIKPE